VVLLAAKLGDELFKRLGQARCLHAARLRVCTDLAQGRIYTLR
jgi:hypothetical protein